MDEMYFIVSWCDGEAYMLFTDLDKAITQFHYEAVFEDKPKLEKITKYEYNQYLRKLERSI